MSDKITIDRRVAELMLAGTNDPALAAALRAALSGAGSVGEAVPSSWQWRRKGDPWALPMTFDRQVYATAPDSEVRTLYAHPPTSIPAGHATDSDAVDAKRYRWLREHLVNDGDDYDAFLSTRYLFPLCEEWPKDLDAAIDASMTTTPEKESEK